MLLLIFVLDSLVSGLCRVFALHVHSFRLVVRVCVAATPSSIADSCRPASKPAVRLGILILRCASERFVISILHIRRLIGYTLLGRQVNARFLCLLDLHQSLVVVVASLMVEKRLLLG